MKSGMSQAALERCRNMVITDKSEPGHFIVDLEVFDPRYDGKCVQKLTARTVYDVSRLRMSLIRKFRIPKENIESTFDPENHRSKPPVRVESSEVEVVS